MSGGSDRRATYVTIIARNLETADGLQEYLQRAGVASHATRSLGDPTMIPRASSAVVLFPDDFDVSEVCRRISALRTERPRLPLVVVTSEPQRLELALRPDRASLSPLILPKPVFGWTILDAISGRSSYPTS
jgi:hypothetical protein